MAFYSLPQYRKNPKYSDTPKICYNNPKIWTRWLYQKVMHPKDAAGIANSVDPDQTAPQEQSDLGLKSSLIWVCTVCPSLSVRKLRIITVLLCLPTFLDRQFPETQLA